MKKMAQAEKRNACNDNHILINLQAPECSPPQVLDKEVALEKLDSQSIKKKLKKMFSKVNLNAKITEEVKSINAAKANLDAKILTYRNNLINF